MSKNLSKMEGVRMGFMQFFKKKDARANHLFDEQDRQLSAERKRLNTELENMRKAHAMQEERARHELEMMKIRSEIDELAEELEPEDEIEGASPETAMVMGLVNRLFTPGSQATTLTSVVPPPVVSPSGGASIPDDVLKAHWERAPPNIKALAPRCTDEQVKEFIRAQMPGCDADTQERGLIIIRSST